MSYTLEGRELSKDNVPGHDVPRAPCIFCERVIGHFNDIGQEDGDGVGWILGAIVDGETKSFLYCDQPPCTGVLQNAGDIWRCGCTGGFSYVENVGEFCHSCRRARADAVPSGD